MQERLRVPRVAGFTLIELMITVAVVAILGTIAMASYSKQVQKSRRTDARSAVMDLAGREEKLYSTLNAYSATPSELGYTLAPAPDTFPFNLSDGYYQINVAIGATPNTFTITATAIGAQTADTDCTSLSIDQLGTQSATGANPTTCWGN